MRLRIGTRRSALALAQAEETRRRLVATAGIAEEDAVLVPLSSRGDDSAAPIASLGTKGAFTEALERALLDGEIDLAVHSLKDLPVDARKDLAIGAVLEREDARDVHVSSDGTRLMALPSGLSVGTGSPRRRAFLRAARPDLVAVDIRGNVDTRLAKVASGAPPSILLAAAGLRRLSLYDPRTMEALPLDDFLPAPGQGAIAIEIRAGDRAAADLVRRLDHPPTRVAVETERAVLRGLGGGCLLPLGAFAEVLPGGRRLDLRAALLPAGEGKGLVRARVEAAVEDAEAAALAAARRLLAGG